MPTIIKTASLSTETNNNLDKIKDRGVGFSEFVRRAVRSYIDNGYSFGVVKPVDAADEDSAAI